MLDACPAWSYASNHSCDIDGRIILLWKYPMTSVVVHKSRQSMTTIITCPGIPSFYYTAIYDANTSEKRIDL